MKYHKRYILHLCVTFVFGILFEQCQADGIYAKFVVLNLTCSILFFRDLYQYQVAFRWELIDGMYNEWWFAFSNQIITYVKTCDDQICFKLFFEFLHRTIIFKLFILPKNPVSALLLFLSINLRIFQHFLICIIWLEEISGDFIFVI